MAKTTFLLIFALVLLLSIHAVLGDDNFIENAKDHVSDAAAAAKGAAESLSESASDAIEEAKETTSSWGDWFKDKFNDMGAITDSDPKDGDPKAPDAA